MVTKFKAQGGSVITNVQRADTETVRLLGEVPTSILSDCMERMNVMDNALQPFLHKRPAFSGSAVTVEEMEGGNLMSHLALKYVLAGDVLVIDGKGVVSRAGWGGLQTFAAHKMGVKAIIIDGAVRDVSDIYKYDIPVYARAVTPAGPHKGWGGRINIPISCGNQVVNPGDVVVGDADGLVVVPRGRAVAVLADAREKMEQEKEWFELVDKGEIPADFLGFSEKADDYKIIVNRGE